MFLFCSIYFFFFFSFYTLSLRARNRLQRQFLVNTAPSVSKTKEANGKSIFNSAYAQWKRPVTLMDEFVPQAVHASDTPRLKSSEEATLTHNKIYRASFGWCGAVVCLKRTATGWCRSPAQSSQLFWVWMHVVGLLSTATLHKKNI